MSVRFPSTNKMMKGKRSSDKMMRITGVTGETISNMADSELRSLLDELTECRHSGDITSKSKLTQELMRQAEESESGEESIKRFTRHRVKKPREQRRRRKDSLCVSTSVGTGGSLDNIADCRAGDRGSTAASRRSGTRGGAGGQTSAAGSSREGGSCCNLSRGSFEPVSRRRRRRRAPASGNLAHHGSLEDLSETGSLTSQLACGGGGCGSELGVKHGGSLQNISQPSTTADVAAPRDHVVIDIYDEPAAVVSPVGVESGALQAYQVSEPAAKNDIVDADVAVNFPLALSKRCSFDSADVGSSDGKRVGVLSTRLKLSRSCDEASSVSNKDCSLLAKPIISSESSMSLSAANNRLALHSSRPFSLNSARNDPDRHVIRLRKAKKKGVCILTDSVDGYRGHDHVDSLLDFIEPGSRSKEAKEKPNRKGGGGSGNGGSTAGGGSGGGGRTTRRAPLRGDDERRAGDKKLRAKRRPVTRSCSLETRSHCEASVAATVTTSSQLACSRYCGDLAMSRSSVGLVSADDDAEFQLVTRRQRRSRQQATTSVSTIASLSRSSAVQSVATETTGYTQSFPPVAGSSSSSSSWAQVARAPAVVVPPTPANFSYCQDNDRCDFSTAVDSHTLASHADTLSSVSASVGAGGLDRCCVVTSQHVSETNSSCATPLVSPVAPDCPVVCQLSPSPTDTDQAVSSQTVSESQCSVCDDSSRLLTLFSPPVVLRNSAGMPLNGDCHMNDMFFSREVCPFPDHGGSPSASDYTLLDHKDHSESESVSALNQRLETSRNVTFAGTTASAVERCCKPVEVAPDGRLHFGYVANGDEHVAGGSVADSRCDTAAGSIADGINAAASTFCSRFRPPAVNVSHFNWREISVVLNSVYEEAVRSTTTARIPSSNPAT